AVEELAPGLPPGLGDVVRMMMRKQPEERYGTPTQVVQALEPFIDEGAGVRGDPSRAPGDASSRPGRPSSSRGSGDGPATPRAAVDLWGESMGREAAGDRDRGLAARIATPAAAVAAARVTAPRPAHAGGVAAVAETSSPGSADAETQGLPLLTPTDDVPE